MTVDQAFDWTYLILVVACVVVHVRYRRDCPNRAPAWWFRVMAFLLMASLAIGIMGVATGCCDWDYEPPAVYSTGGTGYPVIYRRAPHGERLLGNVTAYCPDRGMIAIDGVWYTRWDLPFFVSDPQAARQWNDDLLYINKEWQP